MGGGVSSTMGVGYEMNAIAICAWGGISTSGGKGKMYGPIISTFIMAFLDLYAGPDGCGRQREKDADGAGSADRRPDSQHQQGFVRVGETKIPENIGVYIRYEQQSCLYK